MLDPPLKIKGIRPVYQPGPVSAKEIQQYQQEHGRCWHCGSSLHTKTRKCLTGCK